MLKRPPQHRANAPIQYIYDADTAWKMDDIEREKQTMGKSHPVSRYLRGETRYDIDAPFTVGGNTVNVRQYLRDDAEPTVFRLCRVSGEDRHRVNAATAVKDEGGRAQALQVALWKLCRLSVLEVTDGFDGKAWDLQGGNGRPLTDADMQALYDIDSNLPTAIGWAAFHASESLSEAEGKP